MIFKIFQVLTFCIIFLVSASVQAHSCKGTIIGKTFNDINRSGDCSQPAMDDASIVIRRIK
ncbi:MAG: hypothetical protein ACOCUT_02715, partial [bacterium]